MLDPDEQDQIAEQFGVDRTQVLALARSVLTAGRLSEDVDLIAVGSRSTVAERLTAAIPRALRREFPGLGWSPSLAEGRDSDAAILHSTDGLSVRIQLLNAVGYPRWPTERLALTQRYSDVPSAALTVLTPAGFVAAKTAAWHDRAAPRDLWDLWALAEHGHLTAEAGDLFARRPDPAAFAQPPDEAQWRRDLAAQVRLTVTAAEACEAVQARWTGLARGA